jgi:hypothetical protein
MAITKATVRDLEAAFVAGGSSHHSGAGATLWIITGYCERNAIPYRIDAYPGVGYDVTRLPEADFPCRAVDRRLIWERPLR